MRAHLAGRVGVIIYVRIKSAVESGIVLQAVIRMKILPARIAHEVAEAQAYIKNFIGFAEPVFAYGEAPAEARKILIEIALFPCGPHVKAYVPCAQAVVGVAVSGGVLCFSRKADRTRCKNNKGEDLRKDVVHGDYFVLFKSRKNIYRAKKGPCFCGF